MIIDDYWFHFVRRDLVMLCIICINLSHHESDVGFPWLSDL